MNDKPKSETRGLAIPCCPTLVERPPCESIDIIYRLPFRSPNIRVPVEVTLHFRLERCSGPLSLGDIIHTTTLLPGEKVRLFTSDRHSRFSFDESTKLAYRHAQTSEESFFMAGMAQAMSNFSSLEKGSSSSSQTEGSIDASAGGGLLGAIFGGPSVSGSMHNASSASEFAHSVSSHADSSSRHVEAGVRAASSTSIGEVQTRTHKEGESEDHFESASRVFENPNHCHAISFFFYKIMKQQTIRFTLERIERRIDDPAAPTGTAPAPAAPPPKVTIRPELVSAIHPNRLEIERRDRESLVETRVSDRIFLRESLGMAAAAKEPIAADARAAALKAVDDDLRKSGLTDNAGAVSGEVKARLSWERTIFLPTAGVIVKGCLDDCNICEPAEVRERELQLERMELENKMLARQIGLLQAPVPEPELAPAGAQATVAA